MLGVVTGLFYCLQLVVYNLEGNRINTNTLILQTLYTDKGYITNGPQ